MILVRGLSADGLDGLVLSWVNYQRELRQFIGEVLPLMEQAGLRAPWQDLGGGRYAT